MNAQSNEYAEIVKNSAEILCLAKKSGNIDPYQMAELYGIYYNAFAGALRSGMLYSKEMDFDGYPKIVIPIGNAMYPCKDVALRDILGEDYERLTQYPYEDSSKSFVSHYKEPAHSEDEYVSASLKKPETISDVEGGSSLKEEQKKKEALLRAKNRELKRDARGFQYDPDYDHFYSDRLPDMLKELDSTGRIIAARISCIALSCAGIVLALTIL